MKIKNIGMLGNVEIYYDHLMPSSQVTISERKTGEYYLIGGSNDINDYSLLSMTLDTDYRRSQKINYLIYNSFYYLSR